jgi:hypothetical protein
MFILNKHKTNNSFIIRKHLKAPIMTLGQKLNSLNKEVQEYKIISDVSSGIDILSGKLYDILALINIDEEGKYYFRKYIEKYSISVINECIELCEEYAAAESFPGSKLIKIKERVGSAINLFKEACEWYNIVFLNKEFD